jgi:hypothetical protein
MTIEKSVVADPLARALDGLVDQGVLTADQAHQVVIACDREMAAPTTPVPGVSRLPEALGYLGGALVLTAGLLVVARGWSEFSYVAQLALLALSTLAVLVAATVIARGTAGGVAALRGKAQAQRRRLVGVLLILGAGLAAGTVGLVLDHVGAGLVVLPSVLAALAVAVVAVALAPGVVPTLGVFVAGGAFLGSLTELFENPAPMFVWILGIVVAAAAWLLIAPRLTGERTLSLVLGLATLVITGWVAAGIPASDLADEWGSDALRPFGLAVLVGVAVVGVLRFLRDEGWPWITAAAVASAAVVFEVAGEALGGVVAAFVAGLAFLAVSALLIVRRGRGERPPT